VENNTEGSLAVGSSSPPRPPAGVVQPVVEVPAARFEDQRPVGPVSVGAEPERFGENARGPELSPPPGRGEKQLCPDARRSVFAQQLCGGGQILLAFVSPFPRRGPGAGPAEEPTSARFAEVSTARDVVVGAS